MVRRGARKRLHGAQWDAEPDWRGDECNVVLAIARIWYGAATGGIAPKDVAAT
ncbi:aminoglycoside adenylyltransferase domain-containing protein [Burkholderia diffusa]|uniref:aminoglycoside adenylyltransferase domain-containing protein n=1 Tax=Burkholderia diffusa TaxID=488732 RepID=UPI003B8A83BB